MGVQYLYLAFNNLSLGYIDPTTGSFLLQFIISAIIGTTVFFRAQIARVIDWAKKRLFRRQSRDLEKKSEK